VFIISVLSLSIPARIAHVSSFELVFVLAILINSSIISNGHITVFKPSFLCLLSTYLDYTYDNDIYDDYVDIFYYYDNNYDVLSVGFYTLVYY
jgi:hypothetical protein